MTTYTRFYSLQSRDAVSQGPNMPVEGTLLVGKQEVLHFYDTEERNPQYGEDYITLFPAFHNGKQCWLRRGTWCPAFGYSAEGTYEEIVPFEDGVKLLIEHEVFSLPVPVGQEKVFLGIDPITNPAWFEKIGE